MNAAPQPQPVFSIRAATVADNRLLCELGIETFRDSFGADNTAENMAAYLTASFSPEKQAAELADPATRFLIVETDGAPAGYARLRFGQSPAGLSAARPVEIVRFYSRKAWIGKGAGPFLMRACLDAAQAASCDLVWLDVWEHNPRAIAFYAKWGFRTAGEQVFVLGAEIQRDLIMTLSL